MIPLFARRLLLICLIPLFIWTYHYFSSSPTLPLIAITQFVEHPALDLERQAIIKTLADHHYKDGENIHIHYYNAQGNISTATQIATQIAEQHPVVVIAISTPSSQAMMYEIRKQKIPLVFTAVTDPVAAKLVENLDVQNLDSLVTGVCDFLPPKDILGFIQKNVPYLKNLGIIYNPGESNSVSALMHLKKAASDLNIEIHVRSASKTVEVKAATESLMGKVEVIFIPNDNTAISAIESITRVASHQGVPVFTADLDVLDKGVAGAMAYDRTELGSQAGMLIVKILKGVLPSQLPICHQHQPKTGINMNILTKLGGKVIEKDVSFPNTNPF